MSASASDESASRFSFEVAAPAAAAIRHVHPGEEGRDHLAELDEHCVATVADFSKRMRLHPKQQRLEGLARSIDTDVRLGRGRQHPAQRIERLGSNRRSVNAIAVAGALWIAFREVLLHRRDPLRVELEDLVHGLRVAVAQCALQLPQARDSASVRAACLCKERSASTARDTPSAVPTRALWSGCSRRTRTRCARRRAARPNRRHTR